MSKYFSSVIVLAFVFSVSMIAVSGQEGGENATLDDEMAVGGEEDVGGEGETNIRDTKQDERIEALDKRIGDLHNHISSFLTVIGILGGLIALVIAGITIKQWLDLERLRKSVDREIDIIKEMELEGRRTLKGAKNSADEARECAETAQKELAIILESKEKEVDAAAEELPPTSEIGEKRDLVEEVLRKYPSLRQSTDFMYEATMRGDVKDERTLVNIARSLNASEEYKKVVELVNFVGQLPEPLFVPGLIFEKAYALDEIGEHAEAVKAYDSFLIDEPNNHTAYNNKGVALYNLKEYEEALKAYDKAIELKPDFAEAYNNKGNALDDLKRYDEAIKAYDMAIELKPDYAEAYSNKGVALNNLEKYREALKVCNKAIELKPDLAKAYNNKGIALGNLEEYEEAIKAYDMAIELKPELAEAYNNKGIALSNLEKYDEAIKAYDKAIELKPDYGKAYFNRARTYSLLGKKNKMLSDLRKAIDLDEKYREKAKIDEDFDAYRKDPDFRRLVYPEEFKEGEEGK